MIRYFEMSSLMIEDEKYLFFCSTFRMTYPYLLRLAFLPFTIGLNLMRISHSSLIQNNFYLSSSSSFNEFSLRMFKNTLVSAFAYCF